MRPRRYFFVFLVLTALVFAVLVALGQSEDAQSFIQHHTLMNPKWLPFAKP